MKSARCPFPRLLRPGKRVWCLHRQCRGRLYLRAPPLPEWSPAPGVALPPLPLGAVLPLPGVALPPELPLPEPLPLPPSPLFGMVNDGLEPTDAGLDGFESNVWPIPKPAAATMIAAAAASATEPACRANPDRRC